MSWTMSMKNQITVMNQTACFYGTYASIYGWCDRWMHGWNFDNHMIATSRTNFRLFIYKMGTGWAEDYFNIDSGLWLH